MATTRKASDFARANTRMLLDERGWAQAELARRAGIGQRTLNRFLSLSKDPQKQRGFGAENLRKLASALGISVDRLTNPWRPEAATEPIEGFISLLGELEAKALLERVATAMQLGVYDHCSGAAKGIILAELKRRQAKGNAD